MNRVTRKAMFAVAGTALGFAWIIGGVCVPSAAAQSAAPGGMVKMEDRFKNIQVLKGVWADQLAPTMNFFAASLGVDCDFCHEDDDRSKDTKEPKQTARKMVQMMFALNNSSFEGRRTVTCYSCHRGSARPVGMPLVSGQELPPERAEAKEVGGTDRGAMPSADQVLNKYLAALGGADAIQKISSRVAKLTVTENGGRRTSLEIYAKPPDKRYTVTRQSRGDAIEVYNSDAGWTLNPGAKQPADMRRAALDAARLEDAFFFAGRMRQVFSDLHVERTEKVGGQEAYVVSGRFSQAVPLVELYFDKESGMLVRLVYYTDSAVGRFPTQIDYADYRNAGGPKLPFRWTVAQTRNRQSTYQIDDLQQNVPVEESKFSKPMPAAASLQNPPAR